MLWDHKTAIRWTIANIKGISPSMCMHRILLEDSSKPSREAQQRLNPVMMEVVKKGDPQAIRCGSDLPNLKQHMGESSPSSAKKIWSYGG